MPLATRFMLRRDQSLAHNASGKVVNVPAGTGGRFRELRLFEELYMFIPVRPRLPLFQ